MKSLVLEVSELLDTAFNLLHRLPGRVDAKFTGILHDLSERVQLPSTI